jgi:hypothetical protein
MTDVTQQGVGGLRQTKGENCMVFQGDSNGMFTWLRLLHPSMMVAAAVVTIPLQECAVV